MFARKIIENSYGLMPLLSRLLAFIVSSDYGRENCEICGMPLRKERDSKHNPFVVKVHRVDIAKYYYLTATCEHCRKHKSWEEISEAHTRNWYKILKSPSVPFGWEDIERALYHDRRRFPDRPKIKEWIEFITKSYNKNTLPGKELCGFANGSIKELYVAARWLRRYKSLNIEIKETKIRTSIILNNGKKKKTQQVIELPDRSKKSNS